MCQDCSRCISDVVGLTGVAATAPWSYKIFSYLKNLERFAIEGESPVKDKKKSPVSILSNTGHVESCVNLPRPLGKAKYYLTTDSEQVP